MFPRHLLCTLQQELAQTPGVGLPGPRQVGKTTLAHHQGGLLNVAPLARNLGSVSHSAG